MGLVIEHKKEHVKKSPSFPWLGVAAEGTIILFTSEEVGTVLNSGEWSYPVGHHAVCWDMEDFKPLPASEQLILQNVWKD